MDDKKTLMFHGGQAIAQANAKAQGTANPQFQQPQSPQQAVGQNFPPHGQQQPFVPPPQPGQQPVHQQPPFQQQAPFQQQQHQHHRQHQQQQGYPQQRPQQPQQGRKPWQQFGQPGGLAAMGGQMSKKKIILSIVGAIGVAILGAVGLIVKNKVTGGKGKKGDITYARLGIDKKNANVDELIGALEKHAIRWRKDATWWGLTAPNVRPDGTVDLTKSDGGRVTVKFVSVSGVQSHSKRKRRDSIKEYTMFDRGARAPKIIGAKKVWKDFKPIPIPDCKIGNLVAALNKRGFKDGTVKIRFDTRFAFASGWAWTVESKDKAIDGYYSMNDCSFVKARPGAK